MKGGGKEGEEERKGRRGRRKGWEGKKHCHQFAYTASLDQFVVMIKCTCTCTCMCGDCVCLCVCVYRIPV